MFPVPLICGASVHPGTDVSSVSAPQADEMWDHVQAHQPIRQHHRAPALGQAQQLGARPQSLQRWGMSL